MRPNRPVLAALLLGVGLLGGCFFPPSEPPPPPTVEEQEPNYPYHQPVDVALPVRLTGTASLDDYDGFLFDLPTRNGSLTFTCVQTSNSIGANLDDTSLGGRGAGCGSSLGGRTVESDGGQVELVINGPAEPTAYTIDLTFTPAP